MYKNIYILHWTPGGEQSYEIILRGVGKGEVDFSNDYHFWQLSSWRWEGV